MLVVNRSSTAGMFPVGSGDDRAKLRQKVRLGCGSNSRALQPSWPTFPPMNRVLGADWTYWMFAIMASAIGVFEFFFLPETRGKTLEQITAEFE